MLTALRNLLARSTGATCPAIPSGQRVYAIGDIHGRLDLFEALIDLIEADDASRAEAATTVILLGDLIDRGHDSGGVVARAREWSNQRHVEFLMGNHEEMLLVSRKDAETLGAFLKFGGIETIQSYGVPLDTILSASPGELQRTMHAAIPQDDIAFLEAFKPTLQIGDYLFVHAGIHPAIPLDRQSPQDCRWIREPFLSHKGDFGVIVIHGHTITRDPEICTNRIGIDTGAYLHGTLTAIGLEGTERWFLQAPEDASLSTAAA